MNTNILSMNSNGYGPVPQASVLTTGSPKENLEQGFHSYELDDMTLFSKCDVQALASQIEEAKKEIKSIESEIRQVHSEKSQLVNEIQDIARKLNQTKESLIQANHKLIFSIARKHLNKGLTFIELVREGSVGLEKAIDTFESSKGLHFFTYAIFWIRLAIAQAIVEHKCCKTIHAKSNKSNIIIMGKNK